MVSAGSYLLSAALLAAVAVSLGFAAVRLRRRLMPAWEGAPAHLVDAVLGVALLIWLSELLGTFGLFYAWTLVGASLVTAAGIYWWTASRAPVGDGEVSPAGGMGLGGSRTPPPAAPPQTHATRGPELLMSVIAVGVVATVFAHWGLTTKDALDRGIFNFDSLWYHMPFAVEMAQSHSVTGLHYTETVFTNWFYPQNSELLHAAGILLTERDALSLFLNFGWLAFAFLAAWCIGRPYGRGQLSVIAAAVVLECHTLVVREPGAAKNDLIAASLLLAAIAILVNAWPRREGAAGEAAGPGAPSDGVGGRRALEPGWPVAAAGLAIGLAAGTKVTVLAMAAALSLAVIALAPAGRRWAVAGWWFLPALAGGGFWYLRNLVLAGNPLPQVERLGPISLPHPEPMQSGRPDFSIAHYATDTGVWREYFGPGLEQAFGALWPVIVALALAGAVLALVRGGDRAVRWSGGVALFGMLAYLFTPLGAAGAEGAPDGFAINIRFAIPALLLGATLLPLAPIFAGRAPRQPRSPRAFSTLWRGKNAQWLLVGVLLGVLLVSDRADGVLRDPSRLFGLGIALLFVLIPAALLLARRRGAPRGAVAAGFGALAIAVVAIGYPVQRDYLHDRFAQGSDLPGMDLEGAYEWARGQSDARIGLAGTSAGFLQYGFYGTDLSNRVLYLGQKGPHGAFNAIPTCGSFRAAVNAADLDYLVTAPFLNFIHTGDPISSPEARWLRGESAVQPIERNGPVTVWRVDGELDPSACGPRNAPLYEIPQ